PEEKPEEKEEDDKEESKPDEKEEQAKPDEKEEEKKPESSGVSSGSVSKPASYKEFSLTKDMTAQEAYDYLNGFLNTKYSILINKQNKVKSDYAPTNLRAVSGSEYKMESTAATALEKMMRAAKEDGYSDLVFYSGYRTYSSQKNKFDTRTQKYLNQGYSQEKAEEKAGEYIAPPGSSEHHTGLAADVCSSKIVNKHGALVDEFDQTAEWRWLSKHCAEYGFILRYRKDSESITGFLYEPWHFRYLGVDHATACTEIGITYEEYYNMIVSFRDAAKADI
ncbi:MAG: M15 family metallopeptidase, partial [Clostridia bacterium]|nr:M15 family metallopeptidase [Clostridia bacterium]